MTVTDSRAWILVEGEVGDKFARTLEGLGLPVATCPASRGCTLVAEGTCALAAGAAVVVHLLEPSELSRAILEAIEEGYPLKEVLLPKDVKFTA